MKESLTVICPVKETAIKFITQSPRPFCKEFLPASDLYLRGNFCGRIGTRLEPHLTILDQGCTVTARSCRAVKPREGQ